MTKEAGRAKKAEKKLVHGRLAADELQTEEKKANISAVVLGRGPGSASIVK